MKRNLDFNEISDGKRYKCDDLAKVSCKGCVNCHECCDFTDDTIHLDPYDICSLTVATGKHFPVLLNEGILSLTVIDGVITPYLNKKDDGTCIFLSGGRCSIHENRPGFCRMFPLGRIYNDDGSFDYFIQVHECPYPAKSKIKIKSWLNIPDIKKYEKFIADFHKVITYVSSRVLTGDEETGRNINMKFLNIFFIEPYKTDDFYNEISSRIDAFIRA